jgi:hypothetical protein
MKGSDSNISRFKHFTEQLRGKEGAWLSAHHEGASEV